MNRIHMFLISIFVIVSLPLTGMETSDNCDQSCFNFETICTTCAALYAAISCDLCDKKTSPLYCSKSCQIKHWQRHAATMHRAMTLDDALHARLQLVESVEQIPQNCISMIENFKEQTVLTKTENGDEVSKEVFVNIKNHHDADIFFALVQWMKRVDGKRTDLNILGGLNPCFDERGNRVFGPGKTSNNIEEITIADFTNCLKKLQQAWQQSAIQHMPSIALKKTESKWVLFVKNADESNHSRIHVSLLNNLIAKFGMNADIKVDNRYIDKPHIYKFGNVYLWVKREALQRFHDIFKFEII